MLYSSTKGLPQPKKRATVPWFDQLVQQSKEATKAEPKINKTDWKVGVEPLVRSFFVKEDMNKKGLKRGKKGTIQMEVSVYK